MACAARVLYKYLLHAQFLFHQNLKTRKQADVGEQTKVVSPSHMAFNPKASTKHLQRNQSTSSASQIYTLTQFNIFSLVSSRFMPRMQMIIKLQSRTAICRCNCQQEMLSFVRVTQSHGNILELGGLSHTGVFVIFNV